MRIRRQGWISGSSLVCDLADIEPASAGSGLHWPPVAADTLRSCPIAVRTNLPVSEIDAVAEQDRRE